MTTSRTAAIIPVRVESSRLPRKALLAESGQALFLHTVRQAAAASSFDEVVVATDSAEVVRRTEAAGFRAVTTSARPRTGSERCAEALRELPGAAILVDVQGDWPEVLPADLDALVACLANDGAPPIATLSCELDGPEDLTNPHVVKIVCASDGRALYFSRAPIPAAKSGCDVDWRLARRHLGVYGFQRDVLASLAELPASRLEEHEGLEQLRWLDAGLTVQVIESSGAPRGIETRADYEAFLERVAAGSSPSQARAGR